MIQRMLANCSPRWRRVNSVCSASGYLRHFGGVLTFASLSPRKGRSCSASKVWRRTLKGLGQREKLQWIAILLALLLTSACTGSSLPQATATPVSPSTGGAAGAPATMNAVDTVIHTVLANIAMNGFDPLVNNGLGGLWIDWRYGSVPLQTNGGACTVTNGVPTCTTTPPAHDRLTDLRYLHNLLSYQNLYPQDTEFTGEIRRYTAIVKAEFATCTDTRGWIYDEWIAIYNLSHDNFFKQCAYTIANYYDTQWYHPAVGAIYQTSSAYPWGFYRTEDAIGMGAALIEAGVTFNQPKWISDGRTALAFLRQHAYLTQYHVYLHLLTNVLLPNGTANPTETILHTSAANGGVVRAAAIGAEAVALLHAYLASHDSQYLQQATDLLNVLSPTTNPLGLWDTTNQGYFYGVQFRGPDYAHISGFTVRDHEKEAGRQMQVLRACHLADLLTNNQFQSMESLLVQVAISKAYYAPGHGYLYSVEPDWSPHQRHGQVKNFVTTEAMGIALEALLSLNPHAPLS
jgi:hypothetical protein